LRAQAQNLAAAVLVDARTDAKRLAAKIRDNV
jgi:hypothetical protein